MGMHRPMPAKGLGFRVAVAACAAQLDGVSGVKRASSPVYGHAHDQRPPAAPLSPEAQDILRHRNVTQRGQGSGHLKVDAAEDARVAALLHKIRKGFVGQDDLLPGHAGVDLRRACKSAAVRVTC